MNKNIFTIGHFFIGFALFSFSSGAFWMKILSYNSFSQEFFMMLALFLLSLCGVYITSKAYFLLLSRNYERKPNDELDSVNQDKKKNSKS